MRPHAGALTVALFAVVPVVAVTAVLITTDPVPALPGLPDSGEVARWGLPIAKACRDASAAVTIGLLVLASIIVAPESGTPKNQLGDLRQRAAGYAGVAGAAWLMSSLAFLALTYSDLAGQPVVAADTPRQLFTFATDFDLGRSLAISALLVAIVAHGAALATRIASLGVMTVIALAALLPLALTGHSASAANHEWAADSQALHVIAVSVWVGGLAGIALLWRFLGDRRGNTVARYSRLAAVCFFTAAGAGIFAAAARADAWSDLWSPYGGLLAMKSTILVLLGILGLLQRRRLSALTTAAPNRTVFLRLVALELTLMAAAAGLGVALSQTSPPVQAERALTTTQALLGYPMPPALNFTQWLTATRLDPVWFTFSVVLITLYLAAVIRLRRRGDDWPIRRIAFWLLGSLMLAWATSGVAGVYGRVLFSMHMVQHMTIAMAVPVFLVLGAPVTLALRALKSRRDGSRGAREWLLAVAHSRLLAFLGHPLVAPALLIGSLVAFYTTGLFEVAMRTHTGHVLMVAHFLLAGYLFASVICGIDPGPKRPPYPFRLLLLIATMGFHAFFGVAMMGAQTIYGAAWFGALDRPWGPTLAEDQSTAGALAWAMGDYPVVLLAIAMVFSWVYADQREARRYDRQADRDGDAALAAYNERLRRLAGREQRPTGTPHDSDSVVHKAQANSTADHTKP